MSGKKYLFFIPSLGGGGAERVMTTIANKLCKEDTIKIITITSNESFYSLDKRVTVVGLGNKIIRKNKFTVFISEYKGALKTLKGLRRFVNKWQPDAILAFLNKAIVLVLILRLLGIIKCKLVVSERCDPNQRSKVDIWIEKKLYPIADVIVCQSEQVANFFGKKHRKKIRVIKNPINISAIPKPFIGEPKKRIIAIGRLFPQKRFDVLISAISILDERYKDYSLEIYGDGFLREKLQNQINEYGLSERVTLMGEKQNVMHLISDAALFVLSSDYEGFPNVLIEAMATGIPVITTDFSPKGVAREIVKSLNGFVVRTNDPNELAMAISRILSNINLQMLMRIENRKILDILSEETVISEWKEVLS